MKQYVRIFINRFSSIPNNILFGGGLAYCMENEKYHHIPIVLFFPGAYVGYQLWQNRGVLSKIKLSKLYK